jgi:uncharacterized protein (DUF1778 family)
VKTRSSQVQIRVTPEQKALLKRLAATSGQDVSAYVLSRALPSNCVRFEEIVGLLHDPDEWRFALAELNELLSTLAPIEFKDALGVAEVSDLSPFLQNYLAGLVEQAAELKQVSPPSWTTAIPPLDFPHFTTELPSLRLHLLRSSPVAFKRRNLFVDSGIGARV